jgi:hypothetical protein
VGSGAWTKSFIHIARHNQWILLSATPGDTWMDYIPVFVANGWYRNKTDFTRQHVVFSYYQKFPKVERYLGVQRLVRLRNFLLVEMPLNRHTTRHMHMVDVDYDAKLFERVWKDRWHVYENRPLRDVAELFVVMRKVANSHASRLTAIRGLMETHPKLIVFYNFDYELEELRKLGDTSAGLEDNTPRSPMSKLSATSVPKSDLLEEGPKELSKSELQQMQQIPPTKVSSTTTTCPESVGSTTSESTTPRSISPDLRCPSTSTSTSTSIGTRSDSSGKLSPESLATSSPSDVMLKDRPSESSNSIGPSMSASGFDSGKNSHSKSDSKLSESSDPSGASLKSRSSSTSNDTSTQGMSFAVAEWNGHKHEPIPETDSWVYLVQYVAGAEGWNCVETDAVAFYSLTYSYKNFYQAQGRIDRLNTPFTDLHYYVLKSKSLIDNAVWKSLKSKKSFNVAKTGVKF